jgi:hypothetical protein
MMLGGFSSRSSTCATGNRAHGRSGDSPQRTTHGRTDCTTSGSTNCGSCRHARNIFPGIARSVRIVFRLAIIKYINNWRGVDHAVYDN